MFGPPTFWELPLDELNLFKVIANSSVISLNGNIKVYFPDCSLSNFLYFENSSLIVFTSSSTFYVFIYWKINFSSSLTGFKSFIIPGRTFLFSFGGWIVWFYGNNDSVLILLSWGIGWFFSLLPPSK